MKNRIKVKLPNISTREEAEGVVSEITFLTAQQIKLTAQMDGELSKVREKYETNLGDLAEELKLKADTVRAWAETNPDQFPKGRKSIEFVQGTIGFRTGTPKLSLLSRAWTWEKVLAAVKGIRWPINLEFVRKKEEVNKETILAEAGKHISPEDLKRIGVKIVQEESFFIEPKLTEVETRQVTEAAA
jgi:phage host-nuclease inhibitor protein Gam